MKEEQYGTVNLCHFLVLVGVFFSTNMIKPVGEATSTVQCTLQQSQKTELEMNQEKERATNKTSLVARIHKTFMCR